jgi:hypothetical protein
VIVKKVETHWMFALRMHRDDQNFINMEMATRPAPETMDKNE